MFVFGNLFGAIAGTLHIVIQLLWWLIVIRALLSWVNPDPMNPIVQIIQRTTEPFLSPFRRWSLMDRFGVDLSPLFVLLILYFLDAFLVRTLYGLAAGIR